MKLKKFLDITETSVNEFSRKLGVPYSTMLNYVKETSEPSLSNAFKIEEMTMGAVKAKDLIIKKTKAK